MRSYKNDREHAIAELLIVNNKIVVKIYFVNKKACFDFTVLRVLRVLRVFEGIEGTRALNVCDQMLRSNVLRLHVYDHFYTTAFRWVIRARVAIVLFFKFFNKAL